MSDTRVIRGMGLVLSAPETEKVDGERDAGGFLEAALHHEDRT